MVLYGRKLIVSKEFNAKSFLPIYFKIVLMIFATLVLLRMFYSVNYLMDTYEHIHASWLVSVGKVPYRDFFEHHHPLLWYLFAPITQLFYRDVYIIYVARALAICGYFGVLWLLYRVAKRYSVSSSGATFSVLFILSITSLWYDVSNLRPDIFMYFCILGGILYFFDYLDTHQRSYLLYSYLLWTLSFLFLQKALIVGLGFAITNIWLLYKREIHFADFLLALVLPLVVFCGLLFGLYQTGSLLDWYNCNFTFNIVVQKHYGASSGGVSTLPYITLFTSLIIVRLYQPNDKGRTLFAIWAISTLSLLSFSPYPQYFFFPLVMSAILLSPFFKTLYQKYSFSFLIVSTIILTCAFYPLYTSSHSLSASKFKKEIALVEYVIKNTPAEAPLLSGNYSYNLFNPDVHYYWFGYHNSVILADLYTNKSVNFNELIKLYRPPLLFFSTFAVDRLAWDNTRWLQDRNQALLQKAAKGDRTALSKLTMINTDYWQIDMDFVKQNYRLVDRYGSTELWQRIDNESLAE